MNAQEIQPNEEASSVDQSIEGGARSGLLGKIKIATALTTIVLVECLVAKLYIPSAIDTTAMAKALIAAESETESLEEEEQDEEKGKKRKEVKLGDFHITTFQPITNTTLRIDFSLYGTVFEDNLDEFLELLAENEHRYRDQVGEIVRGSEVTDFTDSGLGLIKRKILEKTTRLLGKPLLLSVIFSDFSFVEQ